MLNLSIHRNQDNSAFLYHKFNLARCQISHPQMQIVKQEDTFLKNTNEAVGTSRLFPKSSYNFYYLHNNVFIIIIIVLLTRVFILVILSLSTPVDCKL